MSNLVIHPVTKQPCTISDNHPKIGDFMVQESGMVVEVKSIGHLEVLVDMGAKLIVPIANPQVSPYIYPGMNVNRTKLS